MSDRARFLDTLLKPDLRAEVERLDAEVARLTAELGELQDAAAPAAADAGDLLPLSYHIAGAPHRGTHVRVARCAPTGDDAERWMVYAGDRMVLASGQAVVAQPWHGIRVAIRRQAGMALADALRVARRVRV